MEDRVQWGRVAGRGRRMARPPDRKRHSACALTDEASGAALNERIDAKVAAGKMAGDSARQKRHKVRLLMAEFADRTLENVTGDEIEDWMDELPAVVSDVTFDSSVKHFRAFFQYLVDEKVISENPASRIDWRATEADGRLYQTITPATAKRLAGTQAQRDAPRR